MSSLVEQQEDVYLNFVNSTYNKKRQVLIRKYCGGFCPRCMDISTKKISYDIGDAKFIEFYCDKCYNFRKEGRRKKDIDKLYL